MDDVKRYDCTNGKAQHCYGCYQMEEVNEGSWVQAADFDAQRLRADTAEAENRILRHSNASFLETVAKVCDLLGIDLDDAKHADGQPSDVLFSHAKDQAAKLDAAKQHIAELEADKARIDWLEEQPVDTLYLDDGRIIDIAGRIDLRKAIDNAIFAALNPNPEAESHE